MKRIITTLTVLTLLIALFPSASAREVSTGQPYVAYLNGNYTNNLGLTKGNIYTANGDVSLTLTGASCFAGKIYYQKNHSVSANMSYNGTPMPQDTTDFNIDRIEFPEAPVISNYVESYSKYNGSIAKNTHFGSLTVNNELEIDTSDGDITLVVDNLNLNRGYIKTYGNCKVYIFSNSPITLQGCSIGRQRGQINIIAPSFDISACWSICANLYQRNDNDFTMSYSFLNGNLISASKKIKVTDGSKINGIIYAPDTDIELTRNTYLGGRVVANNININDGALLEYVPDYSYLNIPQIMDKYRLKVTVYPEGTGTVTPSEGEYFYGEKVNLKVTPNDYYELVNFQSDANIPDANGNITMVMPENIKAFFRKMGDPTVIGDPVALDYSYAYLYGYDDDTGRVGPEDAITREQASALIYRILKQNGRADFTVPDKAHFSDVSKERWSFLAMEYMTSIGVYSPNSGYINPERKTNRRDVAKMISIALNIAPDYSKPDSLSIFKDMVKSDPYYYYIKALYDNGYLQGAGNFMMPDSTLTRAQVVTIINRIIGRDDRYDISGVTAPPFSDIASSDWYYADIVRASNGFTDTPDPSDNLYKIDPSKKVPREEIDY